MSERSKALAQRALFTNAAGTPANHVAAAIQERDEKEQARMLLEAGERIATADDPLAAFQEVVQTYLVPIKGDPKADTPKGSEGGTAEAPSPANPNPVSMKAADLAPPTCREVCLAITALGHAVRANASLAMAAKSAATKARTLAPRGSDEANALDLAASGLEDAAKAAGTTAKDDPRHLDDQALADQVAGGDPATHAEAMSALREYRDLAATGYTSMPRERFLAVRLGMD